MMRLVVEIERVRVPLANEKTAQEAIASALAAAGYAVTREVTIAPGCVIDMMAGDVGVEIKLRAGRRDIYRQLKRYAASGRLAGIVLVSATAIALPSHIDGVPTAVASLGRAWL